MSRHVQQYSQGKPQQPASALEAMCLQTVDIGLITTIIAIPLLMGGRHPLGQLFLVCAAVLIAFAWSVAQIVRRDACWQWTGGELLITAAIAVGFLQIVSLPINLLHQLSPQIAELLPMWNPAAHGHTTLGTWSQVSLAPAATQSAIVIVLAFALLFVVFSQRIQRVRDVERFMKWIALATIGMAAFGLVQYFTSNGKFFWVYEHPYTNTSWFVKGSFTNRNHFTQFLAVGLGPLIWWLLKVLHRSDEQRGSFGSQSSTTRREILLGGLGIGIGTVIFAGLLSLSRGGTVAMGLAVITMMLACGARKLVSGKLVGGMVLIGTLLTAYLSFYGYEAIVKRMGNWETSQRAAIWQANLDMTKAFPVLGTGWATHREAYKTYLQAPIHDREFTHAESSLLQIASESGFVGLGIALLAVMLCLYWSLRGLSLSNNRDIASLQAAILATLAASTVHACFDFVWHVPACLLPVILLSAAAYRLYQFSKPANKADQAQISPGIPIPQFAWGFAMLCCLVTGFWMLKTQFPAVAAEADLHQYQILAQANPENEKATFSKEKLTALTRALHANPYDARLHLRVAKGYLAMFHLLQQQSDNPLPLTQIRDAVMQSQFASRDEMDAWLNKALGENKKLLLAALKHTRNALELCPLEGRGYIYYADLAFLDADTAAVPQADLLEQAERVRPNDPAVLFAVGKQAWLAGDTEIAFEKWHNTFHQNEIHQQHIIDILAPVVSTEMFLEKFAPDWFALQRLKKQYQALYKKKDTKLLLEKLAEASVLRARQLQNREAIRTWLIARDAYAELGHADLAIKTMEEALKIDPYSFSMRYALGSWLHKYGRLDEAQAYLDWCLLQKPHDQNIQQLAELVQQQRTRMASGQHKRKIY